jgi:putative transcriptional regulator
MEDKTIKLIKRENQTYRVYPDGREELIAERRDDIRRLLNMTHEEAYQNALDDPDNPPMTEEQAERLEIGLKIKAIRKDLDLTQEEFSQSYGIPLATLRGWERGKGNPDMTVISYFKVISQDPDLVRKALMRYNQHTLLG